MPLLAVIVGIGVGGLLLQKSRLSVVGVAVGLFVLLTIICNVVALRQKVGILKSKGDKATRWLSQLTEGACGLAKGRQVMLISLTAQKHYSIYLLGGLKDLMPMLDQVGCIVGRTDIRYVYAKPIDEDAVIARNGSYRFRLEGENLELVTN